MKPVCSGETRQEFSETRTGQKISLIFLAIKSYEWQWVVTERWAPGSAAGWSVPAAISEPGSLLSHHSLSLAWKLFYFLKMFPLLGNLNFIFLIPATLYTATVYRQYAADGSCLGRQQTVQFSCFSVLEEVRQRIKNILEDEWKLQHRVNILATIR